MYSSLGVALPHRVGKYSGKSPMSASPHSFSLALPWRILSKWTKPAQFKARNNKCRLLGLIIILSSETARGRKGKPLFCVFFYQPLLCLLIFSIRKSMFSYISTLTIEQTRCLSCLQGKTQQNKENHKRVEGCPEKG